MAERRPPLSKEKREQLTKAFLELDTDGNGWLSREEVGAWLREAGHKLTDQQVEVGHTDNDGLLLLGRGVGGGGGWEVLRTGGDGFYLAC